MSLKRSVWILFHVLVGLGIAYLLLSSYLRWQEIHDQVKRELRYLNHLFSASVTLNFAQQEIMLELIGERLLQDSSLHSDADATRFLDRILALHPSFNGLGLVTPEGDLKWASSNIDRKRLPNLKQSPNTRETFIQTLDSDQLVVGDSYFMDALQDWVIPIRKAIRNAQGQVIGVMAAGIRPRELLPRLQGQLFSTPYTMILLHDQRYRYAYLSGLSDEQLKQIIPLPLSNEFIERIVTDLREQTGNDADDLRRQPGLFAEFNIASALTPGERRWVSMTYLPEYRLWSLVSLPEDQLLGEWLRSLLLYGVTLLLVIAVFYYLVRLIDRSQKQQGELLLQQASMDFLTGLYNRHYLNQVEHNWIGPDKPGFSCWFIDLDNFKHINDTHGHKVGDQLLYQVSRRILSQFSKDALVCRQGGDEFIVLLQENRSESLRKRSRHLLNTLLKPFQIGEYAFRIGASIGISLYPEDGKAFDSLFSAADSAMYEAKKQRNSYCLYTEELKQRVRRDLITEQALRNALDLGEISLVYQPQIDHQGLPCGVEALCRWRNPQLGQVPPDVFIPIAERTGFIIPLGTYIIERALEEVSRLIRERGRKGLHLSINISVRQLQEQHFAQQLMATLKAHDFSPQQLTLEITESLFIEDYRYLMPVIEQLRQQGIRFSMDDFGTGYSSLNQLRKLPIDELKIDKSFIDPLCDSEPDRQLVLGILGIARSLGMTVVAEGVESGEQARLLLEHDCDCMQGYFFSKPLPLEQLRNLYSDWTPPDMDS